MKQALKRMLGPRWQYARAVSFLAKAAVKGFGQYERQCPICGFHGKFLAEVHFPDIFNFDALCPSCGSLPRNRLLWLTVTQRSLIGLGDHVLHFAPETCLSAHIRALAGEYRTADLFAEGVDLKLNIEKIDLPEGSYDVVICSHVLEHVNDKAAIAELYRILRPGGRLLILVPVAEGWESTYENDAQFDRAGKALHYGKDNHIRRYGRDVRDRLAAPGFAVEPVSCEGAAGVRYALLPGENLFICRKTA